MKTIVEKVISEYSTARKEPFSGHPLGAFFRNEIPKRIYNSGLVDQNIYLVTGSVGQGNWVDSAWFAIFNRAITTSARQGVYIVYLLSKDGDTLYLTFNQGCEKIRSTHTKKETIAIMRQQAKDIAKHIDSRGFNCDEDISLGDNLTERAELYQKGAIFYKAYHKGSIPAEDVLLRDLKNMIDIYEEYAGSPKLGKFDSWEIVDETTAIKSCDKSFFEYNGSGVPKEICWYFNAAELSSGETKAIKFIYNGQEYAGKVANDTTDRRRVRIFWSADLGRLFDTYKNTDSKATFIKMQTDVYEIKMTGGEKEMTVKEKVAIIKQYIEANGFNYEGSLIENFYLSLRAKPFVILAGTSGTGKTRLVRLFAEAIKAEYKLVSVRPDWSDSSDLFGHVDLNQKFVPGAIIDFVKRAELDPTKPYLLCLDEMNLARVEYYMSDILSAIETRRYRGNAIVSDPVVSTTSYGVDNDALKKYGEVILPGNLYIVGTVNMDETTFPFSKKVLDRANTIEFSYVNLELMPVEYFVDPQPISATNDFLVSKYITMKDAYIDEDKEYVDDICTKLGIINTILKKANAHIGYRVRDEIVFYMLNNHKTGKTDDERLISDNEAWDKQIMQKILPRIQGSSDAIKKLLEELVILCEGSKYNDSAEKIHFMLTRYEEDGFTSYWL